MGINKVILVGRLGKDPEVRYTTDNTAVATLTLATGERRKDASGQWVDHTEWHRLVCFGKLAELAKNYLKKGRQIYVEGRLRTTKWQDKEGKDRYTTEIVVATLEFLGTKQDGSFDGMPASMPSEEGFSMAGLQPADAISMPSSLPDTSSTFDDDDIPF